MITIDPQVLSMEKESNVGLGWSLKLFNFLVGVSISTCLISTELDHPSGTVQRAFTSCSKVLYAPTIKVILRLLEKEVNKKLWKKANQ